MKVENEYRDNVQVSAGDPLKFNCIDFSGHDNVMTRVRNKEK